MTSNELKLAALPANRHSTVIMPRSERAAEVLSPEVREQFRQFYVDDVADLVGPLYTMDAGIRPMHSSRTSFVGQAITAKAVPGDNLALFGALAEVRPGDVLIVDWRGHTASSANGGSMLVAPLLDGLEAVVVDGAVRDVAEVAGLNLPLFARGLSASAPGKYEIGEVNVAVVCGGVVVEPGDLVIGGDEGIVVIPRRDVERVLAALKPYTAPRSIDDWPIDVRRERSNARVEQYRSILADQISAVSESTH